MEQMRGGAVVFNPPPGWPPAPPGWTPRLDWKPPKEWPSAPAGWSFYLELPPDDADALTRAVEAAHPATDFHPAYSNGSGSRKSFLMGNEGAAPSRRVHRRVMWLVVALFSSMVFFTFVQLFTVSPVAGIAIGTCMNHAWNDAAEQYPTAAANSNATSGFSLARSTVTMNADGSVTVNGYTTVAPDGTVLAWTCIAMKGTNNTWGVTDFQSAVEVEPVYPTGGQA